MSSLAAETVVAQLANAGLNVYLAPAGGLAVSPASHLTADLRALIRSRKAVLVSWLRASNDAASQVPDPPANPRDWKELAAAYYAHHFNCATCIAAGRGTRYGLRCGAGMALWRSYCG